MIPEGNPVVRDHVGTGRGCAEKMPQSKGQACGAKCRPRLVWAAPTPCKEKRINRPLPGCASQRSLHNEPIFRLLLKVAVKGTQQCEFLNFCGVYSPITHSTSDRKVEILCWMAGMHVVEEWIFGPIALNWISICNAFVCLFVNWKISRCQEKWKTSLIPGHKMQKSDDSMKWLQQSPSSKNQGPAAFWVWKGTMSLLLQLIGIALPHHGSSLRKGQ